MKNYKKDFPIFRNNKNLVYLDSAATSQKPQIVIDAINEYYESYNSNIHRGIYPIAEKATQAVEDVRKKVARFINAEFPEEIIFTKGTTEGINLVAYAWGEEYVSAGDVVVTSVMEHHSNFVPWQQLAKRKKAKFRVVDITSEGLLNEEEILEATKNAKVFAFSSVSNMLGTITSVKTLIEKIRKQNPRIVILVDGAQEAPHRKIDVKDLDCDFLVFSGHKMLAETGIGVLYGKKAILEKMQPFLFGGGMIREAATEQTTFADLPHRFEAGTINIAGIISLGTAIDYLENIGLDKIIAYERILTEHCIREIRGVSMYGPRDIEKRAGLVSFTLDGVHAHDVSQVLANSGVCVRAGHHCAMPLHKRLGIAVSCRASFYIYNDEEDIDKLIKGIKEVKKIFSL